MHLVYCGMLTSSELPRLFSRLLILEFARAPQAGLVASGSLWLPAPLGFCFPSFLASWSSFPHPLPPGCVSLVLPFSPNALGRLLFLGGFLALLALFPRPASSCHPLRLVCVLPAMDHVRCLLAGSDTLFLIVCVAELEVEVLYLR